MATTAPAPPYRTVDVDGVDRPDSLSGRGTRSGRARTGLYVFLAPALLTVALIGVSLWNARDRSGNEATRLATVDLQEALLTVPFAPRLPQTLPGNARLVRAFLDEPDSDQGFQAYQLSAWYRSSQRSGRADGVSVHLWQTNDNFLARELRDPTKLGGAKETVAGQRWNRVVDNRVRHHSVTTFSRRFDDGITMTVSSPEADDARAAIVALRLVNERGIPLAAQDRR